MAPPLVRCTWAGARSWPDDDGGSGDVLPRPPPRWFRAVRNRYPGVLTPSRDTRPNRYDPDGSVIGTQTSSTPASRPHSSRRVKRIALPLQILREALIPDSSLSAATLVGTAK